MIWNLSLCVERFVTSKNYNRLVVDMLRSLKQSNDFSAGTIRSFLMAQTSEVGRWPDDEELHASWIAIEFYRRIKKPKSRMILESLDRSLHTSKTEPIEIKGKLTIEHLLPREWEKHWPIVLQTTGMVQSRLRPSVGTHFCTQSEI